MTDAPKTIWVVLDERGNVDGAVDNKAAAVFDGYLVRKDLVRKYARQYPVPTYVVEFLLGRYCASTDEKEIAEVITAEQRRPERTLPHRQETRKPGVRDRALIGPGLIFLALFR